MAANKDIQTDRPPPVEPEPRWSERPTAKRSTKHHTATEPPTGKIHWIRGRLGPIFIMLAVLHPSMHNVTNLVNVVTSAILDILLRAQLLRCSASMKCYLTVLLSFDLKLFPAPARADFPKVYLALHRHRARYPRLRVHIPQFRDHDFL